MGRQDKREEEDESEGRNELILQHNIDKYTRDTSIIIIIKFF